MVESHQYAGTELDLFAQALNWKRYIHIQLGPFIRGDVLEVGAGIGGTTQVLCTGRETGWTCLEPDAELARQLVEALKDNMSLDRAQPAVIVGTISDLSGSRKYDTILYIDVIEHIENDARELAVSGQMLNGGGHLVVLSPAHQWLVSPFDKKIGHLRRYSRSSLKRLSPPGTTLMRLRYLDSVGLLASLGNRLLLKSSMPTLQQIRTWNGLMVPCSRILDRLLCYTLGKTVIAVCRRL